MPIDMKNYKPGSQSKMTMEDAVRLVKLHPDKSGLEVARKLNKMGFRSARNKPVSDPFVSLVRTDLLGERRSNPKRKRKVVTAKSTDSQKVMVMWTDTMQDLITCNIKEDSRQLLIQLCAKQIANC
jgi:hypothetical protein